MKSPETLLHPTEDVLKQSDAARIAALNLMEDAVAARTEAERLNASVLESERRFREIIDALPTAVYTTDAEGRLTHFNPAAVEFSGRTPQLGTDTWCVNWKMFRLDGTPLPHDECPMAVALKEGKVIRGVEAIAERPDGTRIWFEPYPTPLRDAEGRITGGINMLVDITERKHAEDALRQSEERFRTVADNAPVLIWINNLDGCEFVNQTYTSFLGASQDDVLGDKWMKFVHPDDLTDYAQAYTDAIENRSRFEGDFRFRRHDGEFRWMKSVGVPLITGAGDYVGYIGTTVDITESRQDEARMLQAQKLESMGVLAGGIAHDFNNILTGMLGASSLVADMDGLPEGAKPLLNEVIKSCMRAADLTRQILAYSGKGRFIIEPVDISLLVTEIVDLLRSSVPKNILINLDLDQNLPHIMGDRGQLQQVIMNIVLNASEAYGPVGGSVYVTTSLEEFDSKRLMDVTSPVEATPGTYLVFRVIDEGVGLDEETLGRIFDPFFSTKAQGRGLGLSAVLGIVGGHKGGLRVRSLPGCGTTFEVLLPAREEDRCWAAEKDSLDIKPEGATLSNVGTVLVVDDEEIIRKVVATAFEGLGFKVLTAQNGAEGVQLFRSRASEIDCVFLDLTMPVMGGDEALILMKDIRADVPVVVMSGYSEFEAGTRFGESGQLAFLQKPFSIDDLESKLSFALNH